MGSPCNVSTVRFLGWRCATEAAVSSEPWWSVTTLVVLFISRRMGGRLGVGKFGGIAAQGWSSLGRGKWLLSFSPSQ
jgi:hypothetical protein